MFAVQFPRSVRDHISSRKLWKPFPVLTNILNSLLLLLARHRVLRRLNLQNTAVRIRTLAAGQSVHRLLQRVVFPPEQVVAMLSVSGAVTEAVYERLLVGTVPGVVLVLASVPPANV
jgi:hypothetical protein